MKTAGGRLSNLLVRLTLILYSLLVLFPLVWAVCTSFKTNLEFYRDAWALPKGLVFENYVTAWVKGNIGQNFFNSLWITVSVVSLLDVLAASTAYVATRFRFRAGGYLVNLYMAGMMIPTILGVIPTFLVLKQLNLLNSLLGLGLVYIAYGLPFSVFVLSGFFKTIPYEMEEAGLVDGCSLNRIFWCIMLPMARPGIITISIFNFIAFWNEYVFALTYVTDPAHQTLSVGLVSLLNTARYQTNWGALFAGLIIVMLPTLILYAIFQKKLTGGLTAGALKG